MTPSTVSDELLNALVDGQLGAAEAGALLERLQADAGLRERYGELQLARQWVRMAYADVAPPPRRPGAPPPLARGLRRRSVVVGSGIAVGAAAGWLVHAALSRPVAADASAAAPRAVAPSRSDRVIVHLADAAPQRAAVALDLAEGVFDAARGSGRDVEVEIVANAGGLDLLREGMSPHAERLARLRAAHPSLVLVACGQTAQRLRDAGVDVRLVPGTRIAPSALDELVLRLQSGWTYLRA